MAKAKVNPAKTTTKKRPPSKKKAARVSRETAAQPAQESLFGNEVSQGDVILDRQLLLPQHLMALAFGVSVQAFQKWKIKPRMKTGREALYYLPDVIDFRLNRDEPGKLSLHDERARLAAAQAERTELEVAQLRGTLIPADVILENWEPIVGAARAKILAIPGKCKTAIPKLTEANVNRIKTICRAALEDLANGGIPKRTGSSRQKSL